MFFSSHFLYVFLGLVLVQNLNIQPVESISLDFHVFGCVKVNVFFSAFKECTVHIQYNGHKQVGHTPTVVDLSTPNLIVPLKI